MDTKDKIFVASFVIFIIIFSIALARISGKYQSLKKKVNEDETNYKKIFNDILSRNEVSQASTKIGPQGASGPPGPVGPAGGVFSASGPIVNMATKKVVTPTYGVKEPAILYLDEKQFSPIQYWYLVNNQNGSVTVKNKFTGKCLSTNQLGDIFSDDCNSTIQQQFNWMPNMQFSSLSQQNQCISVEPYSRTTSNSNNSYNLENLSVKKGSNNGNVSRLKLAPCSASLNPNQTWYVGH